MSIDLGFRPASYSDFDDPVTLALNGIKGQLRREMVRDMLTAEGEKRQVLDTLLDPIHPDILGQEVSRGFTSRLSRSTTPQWMGGEHLPSYRDREVEIARVVLNSSTMDVYSVRAQFTERGYRYRMVDEYETDIFIDHETSDGTLSLGELAALIDSAKFGGGDGHRFVEGWWWQQLQAGDDPDQATTFVWVESEQYPKLAALYGERAAAWAQARWDDRGAQRGPS